MYAGDLKPHVISPAWGYYVRMGSLLRTGKDDNVPLLSRQDLLFVVSKLCDCYCCSDEYPELNGMYGLDPVQLDFHWFRYLRISWVDIEFLDLSQNTGRLRTSFFWKQRRILSDRFNSLPSFRSFLEMNSRKRTWAVISPMLFESALPYRK